MTDTPNRPPLSPAAQAVRAAVLATDLLEQRHPAPVPVSERPILKSSPFNDSQGRCWCGTGEFIDRTGDMPIEYPASWELREPSHGDDCLLPAHALPLPAGEKEVMAWQPIKTAPKDGSIILLYRPNCRYPWAQVDVGKWDDDRYATKKPRPFWRSMFSCIGITEMRDWSPTHWQPRPPVPLPAGEGGK